MEVTDDDQLMVITLSGMILRMGIKGVSTYGRATQGVRLMTLDEDDRIVSVARVPKEERATEVISPDEALPEDDAPPEDPPLDVEMPTGDDDENEG
jgi:DNA gyrase subunit A